jgi:hypothetical protein
MLYRCSPGGGLLRTKTAYYRSPDGERLIDPASTTACYNCVLTRRPFGPDGLPINAQSCGSDRGCFKTGPVRGCLRPKRRVPSLYLHVLLGCSCSKRPFAAVGRWRRRLSIRVDGRTHWS